MSKSTDKKSAVDQPRYSLGTLLSVAAMTASAGIIGTGAAYQLVSTRDQVDAVASAQPADVPPKSTSSTKSAPLHERSDDEIEKMMEQVNLDTNTRFLLKEAYEEKMLQDPDLWQKYQEGRISSRDINNMLAQQCNPADYRTKVLRCLALSPVSDLNQLRKMGSNMGWTQEEEQYRRNFTYLEKFPPNPATAGKTVNVCLANFDRAIHYECAKSLISSQGMRLADLNETMTYVSKTKDLPSATFINASWMGKHDLPQALYFGQEGGPWTLVDAHRLLVDKHCNFAVVKPE